MNKKFNKYTFQSWMKTCKGVLKQLVVPFTIFQAVRTLLFPSTFDILLLTILIALTLAYHYELM